MSRQAWRYQTLPQNTAKIAWFCEHYGFEMKSLNNGYQIRIEGVLDLYPVRAKYHNLTTHERGEWETTEDLRKIMLKALPYGKPKTINEKPQEFPLSRGDYSPMNGGGYINRPHFWQFRKRRWFDKMMKASKKNEPL